MEFMGIDEKPDSDDYEIAVDLVAGDFYYSPNLKDDGNRKRIRTLRPTPHRLHRQPDGREEIP